MKVILVRHGETKANKEKRYSGWTDFPLTEDGQKQVKKLQKLLENEKIDLIYSSPLTRTYNTAKAIAKKLNKDIIVTDSLKEMNFGIFDGKRVDEIVKEHKSEWNNWTNDYINYRIPKGESLNDAYNRVISFIDGLKKEDKTYLLVTHGGIIKIILTYLLDLELEKMWHFRTSTGCLLEIEYKENYGILNRLICK
ncbi:alpha-ribazole phosphatase [Thermohalobacter berrensis]|uniref:Alpha-ribazole phosphatase n=1 Tax=Thermohalobacter berrensis TaxID=99594 RepID=A0A419SZA1_9FIRM|nr:alpha-ribazole phosphatase [Thermohalobacter berrensis]RKD30590.1 alpha-ribazole phosphatase [Thermohalobacter berrensis]